MQQLIILSETFKPIYYDPDDGITLCELLVAHLKENEYELIIPLFLAPLLPSPSLLPSSPPTPSSPSPPFLLPLPPPPQINLKLFNIFYYVLCRKNVAFYSEVFALLSPPPPFPLPYAPSLYSPSPSSLLSSSSLPFSSLTAHLFLFSKNSS